MMEQKKIKHSAQVPFLALSQTDYDDQNENDSLDMLCTMYTAFITQ